MEMGVGLNEVLVFIFSIFGMGFVALYQGRIDAAILYLMLPIFLFLFVA